MPERFKEQDILELVKFIQNLEFGVLYTFANRKKIGNPKVFKAKILAELYKLDPATQFAFFLFFKNNGDLQILRGEPQFVKEFSASRLIQPNRVYSGEELRELFRKYEHGGEN